MVKQAFCSKSTHSAGAWIVLGTFFPCLTSQKPISLSKYMLASENSACLITHTQVSATYH